jgi:hypothetical protein
MGKSKSMRQFQRLLRVSSSSHTTPSQSTTTRHHRTTAGRTTEEVTRQVLRTLDEGSFISPPDEETLTEALGDDTTQPPTSRVSDPEKLSEEQTQVCFSYENELLNWFGCVDTANY